jgi:hypothetical protein
LAEEEDSRRVKNVYSEELYVCSCHQVLLGSSNKAERDGQVMWHYVGEEKCTYGFGGEKLKERDHFVDPGIDVKIIK